ncbi:MAG TPA: beta-1,6-N-acetylglucosaminyltransferase [Chthoniobacterales bacterium]
MALAFHILAHKEPEQVERLVRAILRPENTMILHFDRRAPRSLHALGSRLASDHPNVILQRPRVVLWGGYEVARLPVEAISLALRSKQAWTHFINLSGQCFPLKPIEEIASVLATRTDVSYLTWFDPRADRRWSNAEERVAYTYYWWNWVHWIMTRPGIGRRMREWLHWDQETVPVRRHPSRKFAEGFRYYGGSNWAMLARPASEHLVRDPACQRLLRWCRHACVSDEIFLATALRGGIWNGPCQNENFREMDFPTGTINPRVLTIADLPRLLASSAFFARKFDIATDASLLDALESHLRPSRPKLA